MNLQALLHGFFWVKFYGSNLNWMLNCGACMCSNWKKKLGSSEWCLLYSDFGNIELLIDEVKINYDIEGALYMCVGS